MEDRNKNLLLRQEKKDQFLLGHQQGTIQEELGKANKQKRTEIIDTMTKAKIKQEARRGDKDSWERMKMAEERERRTKRKRSKKTLGPQKSKTLRFHFVLL